MEMAKLEKVWIMYAETYLPIHELSAQIGRPGNQLHSVKEYGRKPDQVFLRFVLQWI